MMIKFDKMCRLLFTILLLTAEPRLSESLSTSEFIPYGTTNGDSVLPIESRVSSGPIRLDTRFPFFGNNYNTVYVNDDGVISFNEAFLNYYFEDFPTSRRIPIIAPYWADVDTENGGKVYYRQITNASLLQSVQKEIQSSSILYRDFRAAWAFVATWDEVGFLDWVDRGLDVRNTFQVALVRDANGTDSFAVLNYAMLMWTHSTNSAGGILTGLGGFAGHTAKAGFDAGDGFKHYKMQGSGTPEVRQLMHTTNSDIPGKWVFKISAAIESGQCKYDWQHYISKCYMGHLGGTRYNQTAESTCNASNAIVAEPKIEEEFIYNYGVWTGTMGNDSGDYVLWRSETVSPSIPWNDNGPSNDTTIKCLILKANKRLNDVECIDAITLVIQYVCSYYYDGCGVTFTSKNKEVTSPHYPAYYPNNKQCENWIKAPYGYTIKLEFKDFDLQECSLVETDSLTIFDGETNSDTKLAELCGTDELPELPEPVSSTGSDMYLKFKSDDDITRKGFRATYVFVRGKDYTTESSNGGFDSDEEPSSSITPELSCPLGYELNKSRHVEQCYKYFDWKQKFLIAEGICKKEDAILAEPRNNEQNEALVEIGIKHYAQELWIGLTDREEEGQFKWLSGKPVNFTLWGDGEPSGHNRDDCTFLVVVYGPTLWYDHDCRVERNYICQQTPTVKGNETTTAVTTTELATVAATTTERSTTKAERNTTATTRAKRNTTAATRAEINSTVETTAQRTTDISTPTNPSKNCNDTDECSPHTCHQLEHNFNCTCNKGFRNTDSKTCEDIDECQTFSNSSKEICGIHKCVNLLGNNTCDCINETYIKIEHGKICVVEILQPDEQKRPLILKSILLRIYVQATHWLIYFFWGTVVVLDIKTICQAIYRHITTEPVKHKGCKRCWLCGDRIAKKTGNKTSKVDESKENQGQKKNSTETRRRSKRKLSCLSPTPSTTATSSNPPTPSTPPILPTAPFSSNPPNLSAPPISPTAPTSSNPPTPSTPPISPTAPTSSNQPTPSTPPILPTAPTSSNPPTPSTPPILPTASTSSNPPTPSTPPISPTATTLPSPSKSFIKSSKGNSMSNRRSTIYYTPYSSRKNSRSNEK